MVGGAAGGPGVASPGAAAHRAVIQLLAPPAVRARGLAWTRRESSSIQYPCVSPSSAVHQSCVLQTPFSMPGSPCLENTVSPADLEVPPTRAQVG